MGFDLERLSLRAFAAVTTSATNELEAVGGAKMSLALGGALACYRLAEWTPNVFGCAGVEAGELTAEGFGAQGAHDESGFWSAGLVAVHASWPLSPTVALLGGIQGVFPLTPLEVRIGPLSFAQRFPNSVHLARLNAACRARSKTVTE
jgi:hypothetical protein